MRFDNWEEHKSTDFILKDGDVTVSVSYKYRLETLDDFLKAMSILASNYGFTETDIMNHYVGDEDNEINKD